MSKKDLEDGVELGTWLGRRQAFSIVAGRCSAADAQCLRELRESKQYKKLGLTWEACCKQKAGISRSSADEIIRNLDEFGPDYFVIAQVTGISAKEYRRIRGAVANHTLLHAGEEIPIAVENAPRLVAAVEALHREAASLPAPPPDPAAEAGRSFANAERAFQTGLAELDKLRFMPLDIGDRMRLRTVICEVSGKLEFLDLQVKA